MMPRQKTLGRALLLFAAAALACATAVRAFGYDLDGDGWRDSLTVLGSDLHLVLTRDPPARLAGPRFHDGRLYRVPPAYANLMLQKTFDWDSRWELLRWDARSRVTEAIRPADKARVSVHVDEWRGWSLVRVSVIDSGAGSRRDAASAVFQCLESVLFHGMASPQTVRGFIPR